MEIVERQGEGKFAVATKSTNKGDLVHIGHPLCCVPNVGRIRAGTVCCGCLQRISPSPEFFNAAAANARSKKDHSEDKSEDPSMTSTNKYNNSALFPPFVCPACNVATYCSSECRERNTPVHIHSGECESMSLFDKAVAGNSAHDTDEEALVIACLVARAIKEGFARFPLQESTKKHDTVVSAILGPAFLNHVLKKNNCNCSRDSNSKDESKPIIPPWKQFATVQDEINFVRNQPRVSVASLFPEFMSGNGNPSDGADDDKDDDDNAQQHVRPIFAVPPPPLPLPCEVCTSSTSSSVSSSSSSVPSCPSLATNSILSDDQRDRAAAIQASFNNSFATSPPSPPSTSNSSTTTTSFSGRVPSFKSYCDLVSNAAAMSKEQLEYVERLRMRYFTLASKKAKLLDRYPHQHQQHLQLSSSSSSSSDKLLPFVYEKPIDPLFFVHFFSAYASNCFGAFDPKSDKKISAGVYPDASYFNHSCAPNLIRRRHGRFECFYAAKSITKGESLNIDYNASDSDYRGVEERREYLLLHYRFWCLCDRCNREEIDKAKFLQREHEGTGRSETKTVDDDERRNVEEKKERGENRQCTSCNIGGNMRAVYHRETQQLGGFECRFCFHFVTK